MKNILISISEPPNKKMSELLRMAVGLTLEDDNKVSVLFIDGGVYTALGREKGEGDAFESVEIDKHVETLGALGIELSAHSPSAESRGVSLDRFGVTGLSGDETRQLLSSSDITII